MRKWEGVVLHHSATPDSEGVETEKFRRFHKDVKGWDDIGYHSVIEDIDGLYYALGGRPATMDGTHCPGKNKTHLGVCFTGNFDLEEMSEAQMKVGAEHLASLCVMNGFGVDEISIHKDWRQTDCPGKRFPLDAIIYLTMIELYPDEDQPI